MGLAVLENSRNGQDRPEIFPLRAKSYVLTKSLEINFLPIG